MVLFGFVQDPTRLLPFVKQTQTQDNENICSAKLPYNENHVHKTFRAAV
jgi:hypothetical protein